ncbi:MAG: hypothetical protein RL189_570, partial [Pseudomonadota bacterium]
MAEAENTRGGEAVTYVESNVSARLCVF